MSNRVLVIRNAVPEALLDAALEYIAGVPLDDFDPYTHPFEPKRQLRKAHHQTGVLADLFASFHTPAFREYFGVALGIPGPIQDAPDYFDALFRYEAPNYLQTHLDTSISGEHRKVVTLCYYLNRCEGGELKIGPLDHQLTIPPDRNMLVAFSNCDEAYHCVTPMTGGVRLMLTTAFVQPAAEFPKSGFALTNEKAWFVPAHGEVWTPEQYRLRDERAGIGMGMR